jgi:hypothetical protein
MNKSLMHILATAAFAYGAAMTLLLHSIRSP